VLDECIIMKINDECWMNAKIISSAKINKLARWPVLKVQFPKPSLKFCLPESNFFLNQLSFYQKLRSVF
jgi:hypothetical protein